MSEKRTSCLAMKCKQCNKTPKIYLHDKWGYEVECEYCGMTTWPQGKETEEAAITYWNKFWRKK